MNNETDFAFYLLSLMVFYMKKITFPLNSTIFVAMMEQSSSSSKKVRMKLFASGI